MQDSFDNLTINEKYGRTVLFPLGRNKILVRMENSADKFDTDVDNIIKVDMEKFASLFWEQANPGSKTKVTPKIYEMDLTANLFEKEVIERKKKFQWKGKDDAEVAEKLLNDPELRQVYETDHSQDSLDSITLVPQAMRTFVIYYETAKEPKKPVFMQ